MSYQALILLPSNFQLTLDDLRDCIERFYSELNFAAEEWEVKTENDKVLLTINAWNLYLFVNSEPWVIEESKEIAEMLQRGEISAASPECLERAQQVLLSTYGTRIEINSDEDLNMDYFNEYILAVQALEQLTGAIPFEPQSQMLI